MPRRGHETEFREVVCTWDMVSGSERQLLTFIQLDPYTETFIRFGLSDDEQRHIETLIMLNPTLMPIIPGTGGIRKFDFGMPGNSRGSLKLTAFYAYLPESEKVALIGITETDDTGDLKLEEQRQLKEIFEDIQKFGPEGWTPDRSTGFPRSR